MERLVSIRSPKAFSLVEAMLATAVLGIAAAGVLLPFSGGAVIRAEGMHRTLGAKLACDLMEEALNKPFDQVISTCNYTEATGQLKDSAGVIFTNFIYAHYSRKVEAIAVCVPQDTAAAITRFIRVTVTVYYDDAEVAQVCRLIGKY